VGLLLYRASRGVESAAITTMEGCDLPSSGQANERGGGNTDILTDEDRKRLERLIWVMTKLKGPRHQVTLSQRWSGHSPDYTMYMYHTRSRINTKYL
jgi:mannosyltransferase OCH1-like enzyme